MYPELFSIGPVTVYSYGVLLAASYLLGLRLAMSRATTAGARRQPRARPRHLHHHRRARRRQAAAARRRLRHVPRQPGGSACRSLRSGGVFYGGLILAVVVAFWYIRRHGLPFWTTCDVFAPGIALGHVIGRLRMLLRRDAATAGRRTCRGRSPSPIRWPRRTSARRSDMPLHPTQLYEVGRRAADSDPAARHRAARPPVSGADVLALHAALRDLALHHRVLPRRSARRHVRHVLDVAVHLAASWRRWPSSMLVVAGAAPRRRSDAGTRVPRLAQARAGFRIRGTRCRHSRRRS